MLCLGIKVYATKCVESPALCGGCSSSLICTICLRTGKVSDTSSREQGNDSTFKFCSRREIVLHTHIGFCRGDYGAPYWFARAVSGFLFAGLPFGCYLTRFDNGGVRP